MTQRPSRPPGPVDPGFCAHCGHALEAGAGPGGRAACPACGNVRWADPKVAAGTVVERQGRIVLVRRNLNPMYGRWSFPSGYVDAGEVVEEAAAREVLEETGIEVRIEQLLGVYSGGGSPVVFIAFAGTAIAGEPRANDEVMELGLFEPAALPELAFPHDPAIIDAWRRSRGMSAESPGSSEVP